MKLIIQASQNMHETLLAIKRMKAASTHFMMSENRSVMTIRKYVEDFSWQVGMDVIWNVKRDIRMNKELHRTKHRKLGKYMLDCCQS